MQNNSGSRKITCGCPILMGATRNYHSSNTMYILSASTWVLRKTRHFHYHYTNHYGVPECEWMNNTNTTKIPVPVKIMKVVSSPPKPSQGNELLCNTIKGILKTTRSFQGPPEWCSSLHSVMRVCRNPQQQTICQKLWRTLNITHVATICLRKVVPG